MSVEVERACRTTSGLANELRVCVMRLGRRMRNERAASDDMTPNQIAVLHTLSRCGDLTIGDLAAAERVQPPSMTRIVANLVNRDLVAKVPNPSDKRQVVISLTDAGDRVVHEYRRRKEAWLVRQLEHLTPAERRTLREAAPILDRLAGA